MSAGFVCNRDADSATKCYEVLRSEWEGGILSLISRGARPRSARATITVALLSGAVIIYNSIIIHDIATTTRATVPILVVVLTQHQ